MDFVLIIPARFRSTRLPGKPLVELAGKSMIRRVWERCIQAVPREQVYVATDDARIMDHCHSSGIQCVMTRDDCLTGTDRIQDASRTINADLYINVQGDEPLLDPGDITAVITACRANPGAIVNAMCPITDEREYRSLTVPKVVARPDGRLLYMSRNGIPGNKSGAFITAKKQVCVYGFPKAALDAFAQAGSKMPLEENEDIEILRFLELGYEVQMIEVSSASVAVDTPDDVERVTRLIKSVEGDD
jgi:3-deoxy-manno-octulosonate cytidylyltransferase (CMP-KDO synthetase)